MVGLKEIRKKSFLRHQQGSSGMKEKGVRLKVKAEGQRENMERTRKEMKGIEG